jgi:delta(3,5)-delta(2,4)-dienoyl-CoA isomerase
MAHFSTKNIKVSEPSSHVLHLQLVRNPVNAFSNGFWEEYGQLFDRLSEETTDTRVVVLSSGLPKLFTAGIDLVGGLSLDDYSPEPARRANSLRKHIKDFQHAIGAPERCPFPVIVAVHGPVIGLGVDLVSACDIRYASSDATFSIKVQASLFLGTGTNLLYLYRKSTLALRLTLGHLLSSQK